MKKYEFTGEVKAWFGRTLHQIRATVAFGDVEAGEVGGWIEKEENLSHEGNAWVCGNARVCDDARVYGNARVCGNARVYGNARVCDDAWVCNDAWVCGNARVCDDAWVYGNARVCDDARVYDDAWVYGNARVCDDARVCGNARVCDDAWVCNDAWVCKQTHWLCIGPIGSRNDFTTFFRTKELKIFVKCGCFRGDIDAFSAKVQSTHGESNHAKAYMAAIELAKIRIDLTAEE